jgi:hypothetical protein
MGLGHDRFDADFKDSNILSPIETSNTPKANSLWRPEQISTPCNSYSFNAIR